MINVNVQNMMVYLWGGFTCSELPNGSDSWILWIIVITNKCLTYKGFMNTAPGWWMSHTRPVTLWFYPMTHPCISVWLQFVTMIKVQLINQGPSQVTFSNRAGMRPLSPKIHTSCCCHSHSHSDSVKLSLEISFTWPRACLSVQREPSGGFLLHWLVWMEEHQGSSLVRS